MRGARLNSKLLRRIGWVTLLFATVLAALFSGTLDRFSGVGSIPRGTALQSVSLYWLVSCVALGLFSASRSLWLQLALASLSAIVMLGLFEIAARLLEVPAGFLRWDGIASRTLHHIYAPNRKMYAGVYEDEPVFVITNEDGLRSGYDRNTFRKFGTRIAILGDSFVFGFGLQHENTMPTVLEEMLREELGHQDLAVLNAGIVSYAPSLEKLLFEEVVKHYEPTLVILILDTTDIGDDYKYTIEAVSEDGRTVFPRAGPECGEEGMAHYYGAAVEILAPLFESLRVSLAYPFSVVLPRLGIPFGKNCAYNYYKFNLKIGDAVETNRFFHYRHPLAETHAYFDATLGHIQEAAESVRATGSQFVLVIAPRYQHWNPEECPDNWELEDYSVDEPYQFEYFRFFEQARSRVAFRIFDMLPAFQATDQTQLVFRDDPHWNRRGSNFAARTLADYLVKQDLIEVR